MKKLTDRQREVLEFIIDFKSLQGFTPSYQEIGDNLGITKGTVKDFINTLLRKGYIEKPARISRAIRVLKFVVIDGEVIRIGIPGTNIVKVK